MTQYTIFTTDGAVTHLDKRDENSNLLPLEISELEALFPAFNASLLELVAAKDAELAQAIAERDGVYQFRDALLAKLETTGGDPAKVAVVASEALGTLEEKRRQEKAAELAAILEKAEALKAELGIE